MLYRKIEALLAGLLLLLVLAALASGLGRLFPLMGSAVIGILLGIGVRFRFPLPVRCAPGIQFGQKQVLQWSIVALGLSLPIAEVARTGMSSLSVTLATIAAAFFSALVFGRLLRVPAKLALLIGTGTAICGGSAIAAITPVVKPDPHDAAYSLSTIFMFNILAVLIFPVFGHLLGMSDRGFGLWAGTAINDTSSVVAAGYAWSAQAGDYATIVKLTRALLIIPLTLILGLYYGLKVRKNEPRDVRSIIRAVPWFIVWFVVASLTGQYFPSAIRHEAQGIAHFMITVALTAIGLSTDLAKMRLTGWRPVALGMLVWISVATTSLMVQNLTARW